MKNIRSMMLVGTMAILSFYGCSSGSDGFTPEPTPTPVPDPTPVVVETPSTKVEIISEQFGNQVFDTQEILELERPAETRGISPYAELSEPGESGYKSPQGIYRKPPFDILGLRTVTTENEFAFLSGTAANNWQDGAIAKAPELDWAPYEYGIHDMWVWYFHTKNAGDTYLFALHCFDPVVGYPYYWDDDLGEWVEYTEDGPCGTEYDLSIPIYGGASSLPADTWAGFRVKDGLRISTMGFQGLEEFWWSALGPDDPISDLTQSKIEKFKSVTTPTNAEYWCFDCNRDGDYSDMVILVNPSHVVTTEPEEIDGEVEVDIHQQEHKDWGEIKTSIHVRAEVETVDVTIPLPKELQVEADDFAIRTYEAYYAVGNQTYPVAVTVEHNDANIKIHVSNITHEMITALMETSGDGLTIEVHSYTLFGREADVWSLLKQATVDVGYNQPKYSHTRGDYTTITSAYFEE